jgi:hypothetical protein
LIPERHHGGHTPLRLVPVDEDDGQRGHRASVASSGPSSATGATA